MILVTAEMDKAFLTDINKITSQKVCYSKISDLKAEEKAQVEIVLTYGNYNDVITPGDLDVLINLKWIQLLSSGVDQLPLSKIAEREIILTTSRGIHGIPISEYVIAMILYFTKHIDYYNKLKENKVWDYNLGTDEIYGKKVGVLGTGVIGKEIARKVRGLGLIPYGVNRSGQQVEEFEDVYHLKDIDSCINYFDIIAAALPSNESSINLVDANLIRSMKKQVILINVGRGDLIVEEDLLEALRRDKFKGVALDVFRNEPLPPNDPLWKEEKLIITPHISSSTNMYIPRALKLFYSNYQKYIKNKL